MKKLLICALALGGFAVSAQAADLSVDSLKDPLPEKISYAGVTIYGTVDVGYAYQTNGAPFSGSFYTGLDYNMYGSKQNRERISTLTNNALSQSMVGVKVEENIGMGFVGIAKLESGFNPLSGELADACKSMTLNNGKPLSQATSGGDGGRCGQVLNGQAYAGLSNSTYGTLTIGRHNSLDTDLINSYDPMGGSYSMSLIGWSGGAGGGVGMTETSRWDNSLKYAYQLGPVHAAVLYAAGSQDSSLHGNSVAGNVGATYKGFSVDAVYTNEVDGVYAAGPYSYVGSTACGTASTPGCNTLSVTGANSEAFTIAGKYVYEFGGGFKDEGPNQKITLFAGYQHAELSNASDPLAVGDTTLNGYVIGKVNNAAYTTHRVNQTEWAGAKYEMGAWAFTGAYYHIGMDSYNNPSAADCVATSTHTQKSNCSGDSNTVSGLVDYTFNKHFDVYSGVAWSNVSGGLASGFVGGLDNTTVVSGLRLKF
jgi:predicted porin